MRLVAHLRDQRWQLPLSQLALEAAEPLVTRRLAGARSLEDTLAIKLGYLKPHFTEQQVKQGVRRHLQRKIANSVLEQTANCNVEFSDEQVAHYLISTDPEPPEVLSGVDVTVVPLPKAQVAPSLHVMALLRVSHGGRLTMPWFVDRLPGLLGRVAYPFTFPIDDDFAMRLVSVSDDPGRDRIVAIAD